jgi:site-specific DNA-methyltransferase (adenine-specific)
MNRIISEATNEDCMVMMSRYPDKFFDLAIVDPPYGIKDDGRRHLGRIFRKDGTQRISYDSRNGAVIKRKPQTYKLNGCYDNSQPTQQYFNELFRVANKIIIWGCNYIRFKQKDDSSGLIIWDKVNGETDQSDCEVAWTNVHTSVRQITYMWSGMLQGKSLSEGNVSQGDRAKCEKRIHPNHKPQALYKWLMANYAESGDKILDTHMGSQSSRIAAFNMGFDYWGTEIDKEYFEKGNQRFKEQTAQLKLL